jgi:predicted acylesterase/phospholipase RssA
MTVSKQQLPPCDIVMKGGVTSGVVYPLALVELSEDYRFANIGGTSAGAIAAAAAAAAEYGRAKRTEGAGFERLKAVPDDLGRRLLSLFQPTRTLKPLFNILIAALGRKSAGGRGVAIVAAAIGGYWGSALLGILPGAVLVAYAVIFHCGASLITLGVLLLLVGLVTALVLRLLKAARTELPANNFGLCPGIRQSKSAPAGFTDWLSDLIQEAAGCKDGPPLTFGDLQNPPNGAPPIRLAMMTTSLMEERPYTLPFGHDQEQPDRRFAFRKSEWERIFPRNVIDYLVENCDPFVPKLGHGNAGEGAETAEQPEESRTAEETEAAQKAAQGEFYHFPDEAHLPLIVAARMSLSFPGLISTVPLYRQDYTLIKDADKLELQRCLFSDGGLSSNFPIHFFDHLLPNSPTFAITLDKYDERRNYSDVWLPPTSRSGILLPVLPFKGIVSFVLRLVNSAKDWQDNLQSTLPGYRERIVHIVLQPEEGGLNLTMSKETLKKLADYGRRAGVTLRTEFNMQEHRWRRFLVSMARMEETLDDLAKAYEQVPGEFGQFLDGIAPSKAPPAREQSYAQDTRAGVDEMLKRAAELVALGQKWRTSPTIREGRIPRPPTHLRITPKY